MAVQNPYLAGGILGDLNQAQKKREGVSAIPDPFGVQGLTRQALRAQQTPASPLRPIPQGIDQPVAQNAPATAAAPQESGLLGGVAGGEKGIAGGIAQPLAQGINAERPSTERAAVNAPAAGYVKTGIGAGAQGGEIAARRGADGVIEFTNEAATPGSVSQAGAMPTGGIGSIGNGIGTFSVGEDGDSKMAMERFERANAIRANTVKESRRGGIGEGGGRVTVVADSSRAPSIAEMVRGRQENRQAQTDALKAQTQQGIAAGSQQLITEQLQQQQLTQQIRGGEQDYQREKQLAGILAGLDDPQLQPGDRARLERDYLMRKDPKAYLDSRTQSGIGQIDLENKQLQQSLLNQKLQQGQLKSEQDQIDRRKAAEGSASAFEQAIHSADQLLAHKGLDRAVGTMSLIPSMPGSEAADFEARLDTLKAQTFLPQVQALKGMGALSDAEGKKLLDAVGALSTKMKPETFRAELKRVRDTLTQSQERAMRGVPGVQSAQQGAQRNEAGTVSESPASPVRISGDSDYNALPPGALFIAPDGTTRRKA